MDTTPPPEIAAFLDRYAEALAAGDLAGIAACYALPALVVGDAATIPVTEALLRRDAQEALVVPLRGALRSLGSATSASSRCTTAWASR